MKKINDLEKIEILEDKIDKLQRSVNKLEKKLSDHIKFKSAFTGRDGSGDFV